jgi:diguanylate cyclase (GGDEF)-like protein
MEAREYQALEHIKKILKGNVMPPLEGELAEIPLLREIHGDLKAIRETLYAFTGGDCPSARGLAGKMAAAFKSLRETEAALTAQADRLRNEVDVRAAAAEALQQSESRFKYLASHDPLTGAMNRRAFMERAADELRAAGIAGRPCGIVMMDIDHFKIFNDTWGHQAGDEALRHVVQVIGSLLRKNDFLGRYGGEEFVFLFDGADRHTGIAIAERVREAIAGQPVKLEAGPVSITASFGVAMSDPRNSMGGHYIEALIRDADVALYQAKAAGRNRVICSDPPAGGGSAALAPAAGPVSNPA